MRIGIRHRHRIEIKQKQGLECTLGKDRYIVINEPFTVEETVKYINKNNTDYQAVVLKTESGNDKILAKEFEKHLKKYNQEIPPWLKNVINKQKLIKDLPRDKPIHTFFAFNFSDNTVEIPDIGFGDLSKEGISRYGHKFIQTSELATATDKLWDFYYSLNTGGCDLTLEIYNLEDIDGWEYNSYTFNRDLNTR